jgi:hypothetical protein
LRGINAVSERRDGFVAPFSVYTFRLHGSNVVETGSPDGVPPRKVSACRWP